MAEMLLRFESGVWRMLIQLIAYDLFWMPLSRFFGISGTILVSAPEPMNC